jgi:ADP-ribosylation factor GTPase-activating protein 1
MDKWKDIELEKMKVGGNSTFRDFLRSRSDVNEESSFDDIYYSVSAALYRDKIAVLSDGRPWSEESSPARNYVPHRPSFSASSRGLKVKNSGGSAGISQPKIESQDDLEDFLKSESHTKTRETFFNKLQDENETKSDNLPPSQGGKYVGFGNTVNKEPPPSQMGNVTNSLYSGWSAFSSNAYKFGSVAKDGAWKLTSVAKDKASVISSKYNDGSLLTDLGQGASSLATKVQSAGSGAWGYTETQPTDTDDNVNEDDRNYAGYQDVSSSKKNTSDWNDDSWGDWNGDHSQKSKSTKSSLEKPDSKSKRRTSPKPKKTANATDAPADETWGDSGWDDDAWNKVEEEYKMKKMSMN